MTDPRLSRLIAQHERDAVCKTCRHAEDVHGVEFCRECLTSRYGQDLTFAHVYVPSFNVAEYVRGVSDGMSVEPGASQPPLI